MSVSKLVVLSVGSVSVELDSFSSNSVVLSNDFCFKFLYNLKSESILSFGDKFDWLKEAVRLGATDNVEEFRYALQKAGLDKSYTYEQARAIESMHYLNAEDKIAIGLTALELQNEKEESPSESDAVESGKNKISGGNTMKVTEVVLSVLPGVKFKGGLNELMFVSSQIQVIKEVKFLLDSGNLKEAAKKLAKIKPLVFDANLELTNDLIMSVFNKVNSLEFNFEVEGLLNELNAPVVPVARKVNKKSRAADKVAARKAKAKIEKVKSPSETKTEKPNKKKGGSEMNKKSTTNKLNGGESVWKPKANTSVKDAFNKALGFSQEENKWFANAIASKNADIEEKQFNEEIIDLISSKALSKRVKLITNSMLGKQEMFEEAFSNMIEALVAATNGVDFNRMASMSNNILQGKNKKFVKSQAADLSFVMLGQEKAALEAHLVGKTLKEKQITTGVQLANLEKISSKAFTKVKAKLVDISRNETYIKMQKIAKTHGLSLGSQAVEKNGAMVSKVRKEGLSEDIFVTVPVPEFGTMFIGDVAHRFIKQGENVYATSTTTVAQTGDFDGKFESKTIENGKFRNTEESFLKIFNTVCSEFDNNAEGQTDYANMLFDPKEDSADYETAAFFVRVGSYTDLQDAIEGKSTPLMLQKLARLMGSMIYVTEAAFISFVTKDFTAGENQEVFLKINKKTTGNHTLGGGSGRTGLYYRVINNLQTLLITDEDKVLANSFATNPFIQFKGSRNNNPDGKFLNKKYNVRMFNYLGKEIQWYTKAATAIFVNTSNIPAEAWKGTRILNTLDNYIYLSSVAKLFRTEQDLLDIMKYLKTNSNFKKHLNHLQEETVWKKLAELVRTEDLSKLKDLIEPTLNEMLKDELKAKKAAKKLCVLPEYIVSKFSAAGLKGTAIEVKEEISVTEITSSHKENKNLLNFINETMFLCNETYHKPEFATSVLSGFMDQVIDQNEKGQTEFVVNYGDKLPAKTLSAEDCIKVKVKFNDYEFEAYALVVPVNVHDSKNNLVAQGGTTRKQIMPNLQFFNSVRGSNKLATKWFEKSSTEFLRALMSAGYDLTFGKWESIAWEGQKVFVPSWAEDEFNKIVINNNINCIGTNDYDGADVIYKGKALEGNKELFICSDDLTQLRKFVVTGNPYHTPVMKKRKSLALSLAEVKKFYNEDEILLLDELSQKVSTEDGMRTKFEVLNNLVAEDLADFSAVNDFMRDRRVYDEKIGYYDVPGLLSKLSKVRCIEILPGRFMVFEPSMKKISRFFSKELNTAIRAINVVHKHSNLIDFEELIFNREITSLEDFFNFVKTDIKKYSKYFTKNDKMTQFDEMHNIEGYVLTKAIKEAVVEFTMNLNGLETYHQEKLFTKKANSMYFKRVDGFYATAINADCTINEVRINPNSEGLDKDFKRQKHGILMRYPTTGELGYGVKIIYDTTIPENVIACHPYLLELLMGDTDGDCLVVLPVSKLVANSDIFRIPTIDLDKYFDGYNVGEAGLFKKWNKEFASTGLDLTASAIIERVAAQREQLQFNPEFVGTITSMNMTLADVAWKKFVVPANQLVSDLHAAGIKEGDKYERAIKEVNKAKDAYNFFINVVQKQLSQIPIAAKNTTSEGLAQFKTTMNNLSELKSYDAYKKELEILEKEFAKENDSKELNAFDKALGLKPSFELPTGYFMDFINITGWNVVEGLEITGYIDLNDEITKL
ncbi:MAG: hypothetical protein ACRCW9_05835 [Cetobacterium sp.]